MIRSAAALALAGALYTTRLALAGACPPIENALDPDRAAIAGALADAVTPKQTASEILHALGPAHRRLCSAPRQCLEWIVESDRGLRIDFENPCRRPLVFQRETVNSVRQAVLADRAGLWAIPQSEIDAVNASLAAKGDDVPHNFRGPDAFYYDGDTITLLLQPFFSYQSMAENRPEDSIYCLATRWVGDDLFWLTPEDPQWGFQAEFVDGRFETSWQWPSDPRVGTIVWRYARKPAAEADRFEKQLIAQRRRWNYAIEGESPSQLCHR